MKTIQYVNNISEIPNLCNYNFIAVLLTSWQFDVALAYIQSHNLTNGILIVEAVPFMDSVKFRLTENQVYEYMDVFEGVFFCTKRTQPYKIGNLLKCFFSKKTECPLILLRPLPHISLRLLSTIVKPKRNVHYVALDEGLSSYASFWNTLKVMYSAHHIVIRKWIIQKVLNIVGGLFIKTKENFGLFHFKHSKLTPNVEACNALKELYYERVPIQASKKKCVLIFKDYWIIPDEENICFIQELLDNISNSNDIIIKKHPSDTSHSFDEAILSKYPNVNIINSMRSGEELVAAYNPCVIIGGYSNVVFSSSFIFKIPVISFSPIYVNKHLSSSTLEDHIKYLTAQLHDYIFFCQNMTDCYKKLNEIIQQ